jgi:exonuclease III
MKIASFNINHINRRLTNLLSWLHEAEPDIVCLRETRAADSDFPGQSGRRVIMQYTVARGAGTSLLFSTRWTYRLSLRICLGAVRCDTILPD